MYGWEIAKLCFRLAACWWKDRIYMNEWMKVIRVFTQLSENCLLWSKIESSKIDCFSIEFDGLAFMIQERSYQPSLGGGHAFIPFISRSHLLAWILNVLRWLNLLAISFQCQAILVQGPWSALSPCIKLASEHKPSERVHPWSVCLILLLSRVPRFQLNSKNL